MARCIIVQGGFSVHDPENLSRLFRGMLEDEGVKVEVYNSLEVFSDKEN